MLTNVILIGGTVVLAGILFLPGLVKAPLWRATVTPLASIIGSGFLVAGPILSQAAGADAPLAMFGLCAVAFLYGSAIRFTIGVRERNEDRLPRVAAAVDGAANLMLALAYFVSVAYYLYLFAAFGLRLAGIIDPWAIRVVATTAIGTAGVIGLAGGLRALERLEVVAVGLKLAVIGGLLAALAAVNLTALGPAEEVSSTGLAGVENMGHIRIIMGLIILVQGFETSRYLGAEYDAATRVRTMRWAQVLSTAIYVGFLALGSRYFTGGLPPVGAETAIIDMLAPLGVAVGPLLIVAALASQSSAAIADMNGAGGLLAEASRKWVPVNLGNLVTALVAIAITWSADLFEIITYASKAFVAYYGLQSVIAVLLAGRERRYGHAAVYACGVLIALAVIVFAVPARV